MLAQLLMWTPTTWADDYRGEWLDGLSLLVTVLATPAVPPAASTSAVGSLSVSVLSSGRLTSLDGTSPASNSSTVVAAGSWGDVVCDSGGLVYSHTALAVAFEPPVNASYVPLGYTIQVSTSRTFPANESTTAVLVTPGESVTAAVSLPPPWQPTALRYVLSGLVTGTAYFVRVGVSPPDLPAEVSALLPRAVPVVFSALGGPGTSCTCASSVLRGAPCAAVPSRNASGFVPQRPVIGECAPGAFTFFDARSRRSADVGSVCVTAACCQRTRTCVCAR